MSEIYDLYPEWHTMEGHATWTNVAGFVDSVGVALSFKNLMKSSLSSPGTLTQMMAQWRIYIWNHILSYRGVELELESPVYRPEPNPENLPLIGPRNFVHYTGPSQGQIAVSRASPLHCPDGGCKAAVLHSYLLDQAKGSRVGPANFAPHLRLAANPPQPANGRPAFWHHLGEDRPERAPWE